MISQHVTSIPHVSQAITTFHNPTTFDTPVSTVLKIPYVSWRSTRFHKVRECAAVLLSPHFPTFPIAISLHAGVALSCILYVIEMLYLFSWKWQNKHNTTAGCVVRLALSEYSVCVSVLTINIHTQAAALSPRTSPSQRVPT